jgi:hypothetical protein
VAVEVFHRWPPLELITIPHPGHQYTVAAPPTAAVGELPQPSSSDDFDVDAGLAALTVREKTEATLTEGNAAEAEALFTEVRRF